MRNRLNKFFSLLASFSLLFNSFSTPLYAYAEENGILETPIIEESLNPSESPIPSPEPAPTLEPTPATPALIETLIQPDLEEPQEENSSAEVATSYWQENSDGSVTTIDPVGEGIEYKYKDTQVKVVFTEITTPGYLIIKEVVLSDEQKEELGAVTNTAYDISSDMQDGTFLYDLTLPNPDTTKDIQVKYSEDGSIFQDLDSESTNNVLVIKNLNHFTVFVVARPHSANETTTSDRVNWSNEDRIYTSNDRWATVDLVLGEESENLRATDFDLTIPAKAIISGIEVFIEKSVDVHRTNASQDKIVRLIVGGTGTGDNKANPDYFDNTSDEVSTYGSPSDTWGLTLTPAQVNAEDFGVAYRVKRHDFGLYPQTTKVDQIKVKIYYNTPPDVPLLVFPADGAHIKPAVAILDWSEVVDVDSGDVVTYNYKSSWSGGGHCGPVSTGTNHWINASGSPDRTYLWQVQACDAESCSDWSDPWTVTIDSTSPTADLVFPVPGSGSTGFQVVFSEDVNQSEAENPSNYFLNNWPGAGGSGNLVGDASITYDSLTKTASISFTNPGWYISAEQEWGVQNIHDLAGNLLAPNPTKETSTPMVSPIFSGIPSSLPNPTNNLSQLWSWSAATDPGGTNASGVNGYYKRVWDVDLGAFSDDWSWIGNVLSSTTNLAEGAWKLFVKADDKAGNQSSEVESNTLTVDVTPPDAPTPSTPSDGSFIKPLAFVQTWSYIADVVQYRYQSCNVDPGDVGGVCSNPKYTNTYTGTSKSVGAGQLDSHFWWRVQAKDLAGNWSLYGISYELTIDGTSPTATVTYSITLPTNGNVIATLHPSEQVIITNNEGSDIYTFTDNGSFTFEFEDRAGNTGSVTAEVNNIDRQAPSTTINEPLADSYFNGSIGLSGNSTDGVEAHTVSYVNLYYRIHSSGGEWTLLETLDNTGVVEPYNWSHNWTPLSEDVYDFMAVATDDAGNVEAEGPVVENVTYDITPPTGSWISPIDGSTVSGLIHLEFNANDTLSGVDEVRFQYKRDDDVDDFHDITGSDWDTAGLDLDTYVLRAVVSDLAGNSANFDESVAIAAIVSNESGVGTSTTTATITWTTDRPTSSRVVYDIVSRSLGTAPNYGYAFSTGTFNTDPKVLSHSVTIEGLTPGTVYYYRTISAGSPTAVVAENTFATLSQAGAPAPGPWSGQVAGISTVASSSWGGNYSLASEVVEETTTEEITQTGEENKEVLGEGTEAKEFNKNWIWITVIALSSFVGFIYLRKRSKKS